MKLFAIVLLITLVVVSSTKAKEDTLRLEHLRSIDVCTGEKSWLLIGSMGSVSVSDSLLSFDIIVMFDSLLVRPMDVLKENTLSRQLGYAGGPFLSLSYPGEFRISGFETIVPARGNLPLFAINGLYTGNCTNSTSFKVDFLEFNEEFRNKRNVSVYVNDTLQVLNIKKKVEDQLVAFDVKSEASEKNLFRRRLLIKRAPETVDSAVLHFKVNNIQIDSIVSTDSQLELREDSTILFSSLQDIDSIEIIGRLLDSLNVGSISISIKTNGGCTCKDYTKVETTSFIYNPPTSLEEIDIDTERFTYTNGVIQYEYRNPHVMTIVDILGNVVQSYSLDAGFHQIPLDISNGFYNLIWTSNGTQIRNKKILQNR